jgi:crotonobetainyl-CoA:carnitine CoA-transferase CaiB-like acyl-CoA transferase
MLTSNAMPLRGIRVLEFTHMLMGPAVGAILADMGADVIRIEPPGGDKTRELPGSGAGYFLMFNRNKRSICLDLKSARGLQLALELAGTADAVVENFAPGTMDRLGLGYAELRAANPRLVYCSEKGFLAGPYQHRAALDEVAQMMGGLAYMTGPPGQPLRAGASVIDIMGGMFGAIGILAALEERHRTGRGQKVKNALFEDVVYLMGQHMAQHARTGTAAPPMPVRIAAWAIYDIFDTADGSQVFVGVVSDAQWQRFCIRFSLSAYAADPDLTSNAGRVARRAEILPAVRQTLIRLTKSELMHQLEQIGLPFAPINRPEDLWTDPHLLASGGLLPTDLPDGRQVGLPALPLEMNDQRFGLRCQPPGPGQHTREILAELGYQEPAMQALQAAGIVNGPGIANSSDG